MAVPGYSGCSSHLNLVRIRITQNREARPPEVTHQALKPVCLLSPELFTAMNQNRSLLLPRRRNNGLLTARWAPATLIKTLILLSCLSASGWWGKKVLSRCRGLDLNFPVSKLQRTNFLSLKIKKEEAESFLLPEPSQYRPSPLTSCPASCSTEKGSQPSSSLTYSLRPPSSWG